MFSEPHASSITRTGGEPNSKTIFHDLEGFKCGGYEALSHPKTVAQAKDRSEKKQSTPALASSTCPRTKVEVNLN